MSEKDAAIYAKWLAERYRNKPNIIWLNASELTIESAKLTSGGAVREGHIVPGGTDFAGFQISQPLAAGDASLELEFHGKINSKSSE